MRGESAYSKGHSHFRLRFVMWPLVIALLQGAVSSAGQPGPAAARVPLTVHDVLLAEYRRELGGPALKAPFLTRDTVLHRYAARAVGRLRDPQFSFLLDSAISSPALSVRREAARAIGLVGPATLLLKNGPLAGITDPDLRALSYEAYGRIAALGDETERMVAAGLRDPSVVVRRGTARGLEALTRRNGRSRRMATSVLAGIVNAWHADHDAEVRAILLTALNTAGHRDSATVRAALRDTSAEVRRLGVALGRVWVDDSIPAVRWQALRVAGTCDQAAALVNDRNAHVALLALDVLGEKHCDKNTLLPVVASQTSWQRMAHATVALARTAPADASEAVRALARSRVWQARAWAAEGAKLTGDSALLETLSRDVEPNVAAAAMVTAEQAVRALPRNHAGLLLKAATVLREKQLSVTGLTPEAVIDRLIAAFDRISREQSVAWRDPRNALLKAIGWYPYPQYFGWIAERLQDRDPALARTAADILKQGLVERRPLTLYYDPPPFPSASALASLSGATATIRMRGNGVIRIRLLPDDAPATVHTFVTLAERGAYNGRTLHRVVPNFVLQGGSPGADEYDPATTFFMRDEVGGRHRRGTFGISTRGPDTGDGQLFINLVDNVRLDMDYTVFAETISGLDVIDRVQEGDVIESIVIHRSVSNSPRRGSR